MKIKITALTGLVALLTACSGSGTKFFISNHESQPVSVQYKYYEKGQYAASAGHDYAPKPSVMVSKEIVDKKIMKNYPFYDTKSYFDSIQVTEVTPLTYQCNIPAKSTMYIAPVHKYGESIEYLILNQKDTLRFTQELKTKLIGQNLVTTNKSIVGNNCFSFNLKLDEIETVLKK